MRRATITLAAGVATLGLATFAMAAKESPLSPAPPAGTGLAKEQCFFRRDIRNHTMPDRHTILLNVDGKDTYRLTIDGGCLTTAVQADPIVVSTPPGRSTVCEPVDLEVGVFKGGFRRCFVQSIVKMPPAEVAALPKKLQP